MRRSLPQLGVFTALLVMGIILGVTGGSSSSPLFSGEVATSSLPSLLPEFVPLPPVALPDIRVEEKSTESTPKSEEDFEESGTIPQTPPELPASVQTVSEPEPLLSSGTDAINAVAETLRSTVVNIICNVPSGHSLSSISGSGIIIDSKGIILTNAHIAQYFLLSDIGVSCSIRSGGPAVEKYRATPIFIPPAWIIENAYLITTSSPSGTGEHDFALLAITESSTSDPLPSVFPFIPLSTEVPSVHLPIVIAGYGAQFLGSAQIQSALSPIIVFGSVKEILTFGTNTVDVLDLGGSAAAQKGSSGGGVADASGTLIGTITTSTIEGSTDMRRLDAITATYIRAAYASETGEALDLLLLRSLEASRIRFQQIKESLEEVLLSHLQ
jgi:hypothetical protein